MGRLDGKVALITGAARGQGAAEARLFAHEGASVVLSDVLDAEGGRTASEIGDGATYLHHDVTREEEWRTVVAATLERHGRIDVLVNNAGIVGGTTLRDTSLEEYMRVISVNQVGVFLGMQAVAGSMVEAGAGSIINISSIAGFTGRHGPIPYTASKWAVRGMTKVAARELAPSGVRVNSIHPGAIDTAMVQAVSADQRAQIVSEIPMDRVAEPEAVAKLALYLASDDSAYSTGSEFIVDGGWIA